MAKSPLLDDESNLTNVDVVLSRNSGDPSNANDGPSTREALWGVMLRDAGSDAFVTADSILDTRTWMKDIGVLSKFDKSDNRVKLGGFE